MIVLWHWSVMVSWIQNQNIIKLDLEITEVDRTMKKYLISDFMIDMKWHHISYIPDIVLVANDFINLWYYRVMTWWFCNLNVTSHENTYENIPKNHEFIAALPHFSLENWNSFRKMWLQKIRKMSLQKKTFDDEWHKMVEYCAMIDNQNCGLTCNGIAEI